MMMLQKNIRLKSRGVLSLSGKDTNSFLQGLITNDIKKLSEARPLYAAILSPQGKYLFDFILYKKDSHILLDCERARADDLLKRLLFYRLRADVSINNVSDSYSVWALESGLSDPRHPLMGARDILTEEEGNKLISTDEILYEKHRLLLGIPDGSRDMEVDKRPILEANFRELNGVSFEKGCYVGQEVTARMHYRNAVRKRLYPVHIDGDLPEPRTPITANGVKVGTLYSGLENRAIALLRNETVETKAVMECDGKVITIQTN